MSIFTKINSLFLAATIVFTTLGQVQTIPGTDQVLTHSGEADAPNYSGISVQNIWAVINLDSSSSLFNFNSNSESQEDQRNSLKTIAARESALTNISSLYLLYARDIAINITVSDLLYPFHFYF